MDMTQRDVVEAAFYDELGKINKQAGLASSIGKFLKGGVGGFKALGSKAGRAGLATQAKALPGRLSAAYKGGGLKGVGKALSRSQPVQMAALGAGGLYAGKKILD